MKNYIKNCENERLVFEKEEIWSKRHIPIIGKLLKNVISGIQSYYEENNKKLEHFW